MNRRRRSFAFTLFALAVLIPSALCRKRSNKADSTDPSKSTVDDDDSSKTREQRLFPIFQVVRFSNTFCLGSSTRNGTCYTSAECTSKAGSVSGTCASGYGVCCIFTLSCGGTTSQNCTYLVQTSTTKVSANPCTYNICKSSSNVCRIRLDFNMFVLADPQDGMTTAVATSASSTTGGGIGDCVTDTFSLTGSGGGGSPIICGVNTGQHMIVDASDSCNVASFNLGAGQTSRNWDIKVTQYACGDQKGGPSGCLQYFTGVSGTFASYNFPTGSTVGATATHLSSQCYTICFRQEAGYCAICFTPTIQPPASSATSQNSFGLGLSGAAIATSQVDTGCTLDYLMIPGATDNTLKATPLEERICGRIFSYTSGATQSGSVCTKSVPFAISFKTGSNEVTSFGTTTMDATTNEQIGVPGGIVGFQLNYVEQKC